MSFESISESSAKENVTCTKFLHVTAILMRESKRTGHTGAACPGQDDFIDLQALRSRTLTQLAK